MGLHLAQVSPLKSLTSRLSFFNMVHVPTDLHLNYKLCGLKDSIFALAVTLSTYLMPISTATALVY